MNPVIALTSAHAFVLVALIAAVLWSIWFIHSHKPQTDAFVAKLKAEKDKVVAEYEHIEASSAQFLRTEEAKASAELGKIKAATAVVVAQAEKLAGKKKPDATATVTLDGAPVAAVVTPAAGS